MAVVAVLTLVSEYLDFFRTTRVLWRALRIAAKATLEHFVLSIGCQSTRVYQEDDNYLGEFLLADVLGLNGGAVNVVAVKHVLHRCGYFHEIGLFETQHVHAADQLVVDQRPHVQFVDLHHT